MRVKGWILDPYVRGPDAVLWLKTVDGEAIRLVDRYRPAFLAEPGERYTPENVESLLEQHPCVRSTRIVSRYPTLRRESARRVVEVKVDKAEDLADVLGYAERLPEVKDVYNTGLTPTQWHLISREAPPTSLCMVEARGGRVRALTRVDDDEAVEPPGFKVLHFQVSDSERVRWITVTDEERNPVESFTGEERKILHEFRGHILREDPDILVTDSPAQTARHLVKRGEENRLGFRWGRGGERYHGRVLVGSSSYADMGVAGLVERARFTYAPMGVSHDWAAGKTIDSRQCAEAVKLGVMVPRMRGGAGFSMSAWDLVRDDKGGLVFSPVPGLHENVAALDFESMFPNIIVRHNLSYETVTPGGVDEGVEGFLGRITDPFLRRRLHFKHLRDTYPPGSPEWLWCQQRQASLKLFLVVYYGYSACYANRFANVRVFQRINQDARAAMVEGLNVALSRGYEVIYGPFDSLFVKREDATRRDFEDLAAEVSERTGLPMGVDRHFRYLVLLTKTTDPSMMAANRYYGKLVDGGLFYRGIEVRRHDTPPYIVDMQMRMMETLFDAGDAEAVLGEQLPRALNVAGGAYIDVLRGRVGPSELVVSKRLRREAWEYRVKQPHVVAAMLGGMEEVSEYVLVNSDSENPFRRVMPAGMIDEAHRAYDRKKYASMVRRAAWNLVRPFVSSEGSIGSNYLRRTLDAWME